MCYSAQASLITAGYLLAAGAWCLAHNKIKHAYLFACMPILFAAQQLAEAAIWLSDYAGPFANYMPYVYLFFAFFMWPIYIPLSIYCMEPMESVKKHLLRLCGVGAGVSAALYAYVINYGATAEPLACHIYYSMHIPETVRIILTLLYLSVTVIPFILSTIPGMPLFGALLLGSYMLSYYFYYTHILSVWCFFAALLSGCVCIIINSVNKKSA